MTKQEYQHIRNLSWDLLIDANITSLPTNITSIAKIHNCQNKILNTDSLFNNALSVSQCILSIFGYPTSIEYQKCLAVRILAPSIVLKELKVKTASEVMEYTYLPPIESVKWLERLQELIKRNKFGMSNMEVRVLKQFQPWITTRLK